MESTTPCRASTIYNAVKHNSATLSLEFLLVSPPSRVPPSITQDQIVPVFPSPNRFHASGPSCILPNQSFRFPTSSRLLSPQCYTRRGKLKTFLNPRAYIEAELRIFQSPRAEKEARVLNFSRSQGPYKVGKIGIFPSFKVHIDVGVPNPIYRHISSYSFIFSTYFFVFFTYLFIFSTSTYFFIYYRHISFIFLHIFDIFLHIPSYLLDQGIPGCEVIRGWGVYSQILKLRPRSTAGNFSKSPVHFSECDIIRGGWRGVYSQILILYSAGHKT